MIFFSQFLNVFNQPNMEKSNVSKDVLCFETDFWGFFGAIFSFLRYGWFCIEH